VLVVLVGEPLGEPLGEGVVVARVRAFVIVVVTHVVLLVAGEVIIIT